MKKAAYKHHHKRVMRCFEKWTHRLGLGWWKITFRGYDRQKVFRQATGADKRTYMTVTADWEYLQATIWINLPLMATLDDAEMESYVVHELVHLLVIEADEQEDHTKHVERVVTNLAKLCTWHARLTSILERNSPLNFPGL